MRRIEKETKRTCPRGLDCFPCTQLNIDTPSGLLQGATVQAAGMLEAVCTVNDLSQLLLAGLSPCAPKLTGSLGSSSGGWASPALQSSGEEAWFGVFI